MANELRAILTDTATRDWFHALPDDVAEAVASLAGLRAFFVSLVASSRTGRMDLYPWRETHAECQMALMLAMKAVLPFRGTMQGEPARLADVELKDTAWTLQVESQMARASLQCAHGRSRQAWYEALMFSAAALARHSGGARFASSSFSTAWQRMVDHAREDADDLKSNSLRTVLSSALFSEEWLGGDLEFYYRAAISPHEGEAEDEPRFEYWRRWYKGFLFGQPLDWNVMADIASLPNDTWFGSDGLNVLPAAIREIEARHMAQAAGIREALELNPETNKYAARPVTASNAERLSRHLSRVEDALEDIIALGGGNGLTANTAEFRIIKRLVSKYGNDPERVAFDLTDVNKSIRRQIDVGEYADDEPLRLLQAASTACVAFVCDTHDDVAQELARGLDPEPQAVSEQDALVLEEAWQVSVQMLEDGAAQTTLEDRAEILAGQVVDAQSDPMPEWSPGVHAMRSIVLRRQISRLWQQAQGLATVPELARLYDSEHSKALGYVGRAGGALGTLYAAILVLGRIRGSG